LTACASSDAKNSNKWRNSDGLPKTKGFEEVTGAKDGERVTLTDWVDIKYLCLDVTETQREVCTTALTRTNPDNTFPSLEIKLRVCSPERRTNCIVWPAPPYPLNDLRDVFVYDDTGSPIDFDGMRIIEPPNTWMFDSVKLKLTGRVTVIDGQGRLIEPIEKIEPE
jgi:hypothetical protein